MGLQRRDSRGQNVQPAGAPPPKLKVKLGADGKMEIAPPDGPEPSSTTQPEERPPHPGDPRPAVSPDVAGF
jgi:hypothetical protein